MGGGREGGREEGGNMRIEDEGQRLTERLCWAVRQPDDDVHQGSSVTDALPLNLSFTRVECHIPYHTLRPCSNEHDCISSPASQLGLYAEYMHKHSFHLN